MVKMHALGEIILNYLHCPHIHFGSTYDLLILFHNQSQFTATLSQTHTLSKQKYFETN